jgi:3-hydroxyacyl-[acyl-carrier-protein] dehydratase
LRSFVTPGQSLIATAELAHEGSGYAITKASIAANGKTVCDATLTFSVVAFPNAVMIDHMRERANQVGFPMGAPADG